MGIEKLNVGGAPATVGARSDQTQETGILDGRTVSHSSSSATATAPTAIPPPRTRPIMTRIVNQLAKKKGKNAAEKSPPSMADKPLKAPPASLASPVGTIKGSALEFPRLPISVELNARLPKELAVEEVLMVDNLIAKIDDYHQATRVQIAEAFAARAEQRRTLEEMLFKIDNSVTRIGERCKDNGALREVIEELGGGGALEREKDCLWRVHEAKWLAARSWAEALDDESALR